MFALSALPKRWISVTAPVRAVLHVKPAFLDQVRGDDPIHNTEYLFHDRWLSGEQESQRIRKAQHPLTHRLLRNDSIDQQRGAFRHTPRPAARTKAAI